MSKPVIINNNKQNFSSLHKKWKTLIVFGIISLFVMVALTILVILIFKTDVIPLEALMGMGKDSSFKDIDLDKYDDFFDELDRNEIDRNIDDKLMNIQLEDEFLEDDIIENIDDDIIEENKNKKDDDEMSVLVRMSTVLDRLENDINKINIDKKEIEYLIKNQKKIKN